MNDQKPTLDYRTPTGTPPRAADVIVSAAGWMAFVVGVLFCLAVAVVGLLAVFGERLFIGF